MKGYFDMFSIKNINILNKTTLQKINALDEKNIEKIFFIFLSLI